MEERERRTRRGLIGDIRETLRQAFGRITINSAKTELPAPALQGLDTAAPANVCETAPGIEAQFQSLDTMGPSCDVAELRLCGTGAAVVAAELPVHMFQLQHWEPPEPHMRAASLANLDAGFTHVRGYDVASLPGVRVARTRGLSLGNPHLARIGFADMRTRVKTLVGLDVSGRIVRDASGGAKFPVRRRLRSGEAVGTSEKLRAVRALVSQTKAAPKDLELVGLAEPLPDAEPRQLAVDEAGGILLVWYARGVAAGATLTLAVGRHAQTGEVLVARIPR